MRLDYGSDLLDHRPVGFALDFCCTLDVSTASLPILPAEAVSCCVVNCTSHLQALDQYCEKLPLVCCTLLEHAFHIRMVKLFV